MEKEITSDNLKKAIRKSIQVYGQQSESICKLEKILNDKDIITNEMFQIFPNNNQIMDTYNILVNFYSENKLYDNEKLTILRELVKLNIKKKEICIIILQEIKKIMKNDDTSICWELCDLLYSLKQGEFITDYIQIATCERLKSSRQMIFLLMGKLKEGCFIPIILNNLNDESVNGHALSALSNYPDEKYDVYFLPFLNDRRKWVKKLAQKRLKK